MDISDAARQAVIIGLSQGGMAGKMAGGLTSLLWPTSGDDVWGSIRGRVEALINQKIQEYEYRTVSDDLKGLKKVLKLYLRRVQYSADDPASISQQYHATRTAFTNALPHFQSAPAKLLLLPLFAQFANLHLSLLRDGARFGLTWQWKPDTVEDEKRLLRETIQEYCTYADDTYQAGLPHPDNPSYRQEWTALNRYMREMTLTVLDHRHSWPFFNVDAGPLTHPTRTIYSDPVGGMGGVGFPEPSLERITALNVWGSAGLHGMRARYGERWGEPQRWTDEQSTRSQEIMILANEPITSVQLTFARFSELHDPYRVKPHICTTLYATMSNNTVVLFAGDPRFQSFFMSYHDVTIAYDSHVLGSVFIMEVGEGTMVFGFRLANSY